MSPKQFIQELCEISIADDIMRPSEIRGYSDQEILQIEVVMSVRLPSYYKEFLRVLGKGGGGLMRGTHIFPKSVDVVTQWKPLAVRLMTAAHVVGCLPESAFVFADHQGYQFWYFLTDPIDDDPAVFHYLENAVSARKLHDHFTEFLSAMVAEDRRVKNVLIKRLEEVALARAAGQAKHKLPENRNS